MEAQGGGGGGEPDSAWVRTLTHTYYYYSGNEVSVVVEKADNGTILDWSHNVYAVGRKICSASRGALAAEALTKNFIVSDHQGNVRNVFNYDAQQNIVLNAAYWYNPFGKQDSVVVYGTGGHRFTYNDKELDDELGFEMYYYGARFYDPSIGRFSSPDPVKDYHNPYSYVRNNPIRYIDPTGMAGFPWGGGGKWATYGGIIGGGINVNMDDPMFSYSDLKNEGFNIFGFSYWMIYRGGGSSGANSSSDPNGLSSEEYWALFSLGLEAVSTGGMSMEAFEKMMALAQAGKIHRVPDNSDFLAQWVLDPKDGIIFQDENYDILWADERIEITESVLQDLVSADPTKAKSAFSTVVHEVGHAMAFDDYYSGRNRHYNADRDPSGFAAQAQYWMHSGQYHPYVHGTTGRDRQLDRLTDAYRRGTKEFIEYLEDNFKGRW